MTPKIDSWASAPRTVCSGGKFARDNRLTFEKFKRLVSAQPSWMSALIAEADQWGGDITCAVLEAGDGRIGSIPWRAARAVFPDGWELSPTTDDESAAQAIIDADAQAQAEAELANWQAGATRRAEAELADKFAPHTKYDC
jgi:hypothetical protein